MIESRLRRRVIHGFGTRRLVPVALPADPDTQVQQQDVKRQTNDQEDDELRIVRIRFCESEIRRGRQPGVVLGQ
jgi:hypothetical protein